jgi:putative endonuclease
MKAPGYTCNMAWYLYLIECADNSIYTGIAVDVDARYQQHLNGTGARYTRSHAPRRLLASFEMADRSAASKAEYAVKKMPPLAKRALAAGLLPLPVPVAPPVETVIEEAGGEV